MKTCCKYLILCLMLFFLTVEIPSAQEISCRSYLQYPAPGHPVEITELHSTDKSFQFIAELSRLKLILLEPGICEAEMADKGWYQGRVFVFKSRTANFSHGDIITIEAGRFR